MWFESLDQKQFMLYAQQSARLNTAYWLAVLTSHKCEEEEATPIVRAEIEGFKRQIANAEASLKLWNTHSGSNPLLLGLSSLEAKSTRPFWIYRSP